MFGYLLYFVFQFACTRLTRNPLFDACVSCTHVAYFYGCAAGHWSPDGGPGTAQNPQVLLVTKLLQS